MTKINKNKYNCVCCSSVTIEKKQFNTTNNCFSHQLTNHGLQCIECGSFICTDCISSFYQSIQLIKHDVHDDFITYLETLEEYHNKKRISQPFIGHCCVIKKKDLSIMKKLKN